MENKNYEDMLKEVGNKKCPKCSSNKIKVKFFEINDNIDCSFYYCHNCGHTF